MENLNKTNSEFKQTIDNYRAHVAMVNFETAGKNEIIKDYNKMVKSKSHYVKHFNKSFKKSHKHLGIEAYNAEVEYYRLYGVLLLKRKFGIIKYASETSLVDYLKSTISS